ncbi:GNAT family N-acetyltransferase [Sphingomonas sp.]|uniref:GNAT family N-acetyltransferase n=1 Tax=Sphingomonas sp. TaxID=28214 RepID=UPI002DD65F14|nr:GNAT family N-acetyltransferase [Sphingomonas sp.]
MTVITETDRLILREIVPADASFLHALLTDADFLANIGDRGVKTVEDAEIAIRDRYGAAYAKQGFGMWAVEGKADGVPLGMAGLVNRDGLDDIDIGYAFLPAARGRGYALEAARAVMALAREKGIAPVVAIVNAGNAKSIAVLEAIGLVADRPVRLPGADHDVMLYVSGDEAATPVP